MYMNKNTHLPLSYAPTSLQQLTWHDGTIPENEVWVKLGGDKGGHTFKMNFQIVNVPHPNSIHNTCVFAVFEASDSVTNLHIALDRYKYQITALQNTQWRLELNQGYINVKLSKLLWAEFHFN